MPFRKSIFLAVLCCSAVPALGTIQWAGGVTDVKVDVDTATFTISPGAIASVQMVTDDVVRVRFNPTGVFTTKVTGAVLPRGSSGTQPTIVDTASATYLASSQLVAVILKNPFQLVVFRADGSLVNADTSPGVAWDAATGLIFASKFALVEEHYFGLGERGGPIDRRGRVIYMANSDHFGYSEFADPLYASFPFFYGLRNGQAFGLFLDNAASPFFDLDSQSTGSVVFGAMEGELDYYLMVGPAPQQVATAYARLTGFPPLPPKWALGYQQSKYTYASQAEVLSVASQFRSLQIPCDALYLDLGYLNQLQIFSWDGVHFPDPVQMNSSLSAQGFATVNIFDPVVLTTDPLWPYLAGSGFFLTASDGTPLVNNIFYGDVSWLDFTKPAARAWYESTLEAVLSGGVTAVWNDLNEPAQNNMPEAIYDFNEQKRTDLEARDLYALNETAASYEAQAQLRPDVRPWVLSRSGYSGIQRYAAMWSGDTLSTFDSLRVSVEMSQSMGLSGLGQFGHDVGGFLGTPSPELFIRWLEFDSLTPLFRTHSDGTAREPWVYGEPYTTTARNVIGFRYTLLPYLYSLTAHAATSAEPVLAPLFFYFPTDSVTYSMDQEFMLGPSLLVAPVLVEGAITRAVYLPSGAKWIDFRSDVVYDGGQTITVNGVNPKNETRS